MVVRRITSTLTVQAPPPMFWAVMGGCGDSSSRDRLLNLSGSVEFKARKLVCETRRFRPKLKLIEIPGKK